MQPTRSSSSRRRCRHAVACLALATAAMALLAGCSSGADGGGTDASTSAICDADQAGGTACRVSEGGHCVPHGASFLCDLCPNGFSVAATSDACVDVNECASNNGGCAQACTNSLGGFTCSCSAGYALAGDARGCTAIVDGGAQDGSMDAAVDGSMDAAVDAGMDAAMDAAVSTPDGMVAAGCSTSNDPVAADMAQPVVMFTINRLQLPVGGSPTVTEGLDIDGQATASTSDPAGCFVADTKATPSSTTSNVDDQLASVSAAMVTLGVNWSTSLQDAIAPSSGPASLEIRIALANWNHTLDDGCVTVSIYAGTPGSPTLLGSQIATLDAGVSGVITGFAPATLPTRTNGVAGCVANGTVDCGNGQTQDCDATLELLVYGLRARLHLAPTAGSGWQLVTNRPVDPSPGTNIADPTLLAGYLYWGARSGTPAAGTFQDDLKNFLCELGEGGQWATVQSYVVNKLDLHSTASGNDRVLSSCSGTNASNGNADTISFGAYAGSGY